MGSCYLIGKKKDKNLQSKKSRNLYLLPLEVPQYSRVDKLNGKSRKVPPPIRKSTRDFKKDHPIFMVLSISPLTVNSSVVAVAWEFESLMNIWAFVSCVGHLECLPQTDACDARKN